MYNSTDRLNYRIIYTTKGMYNKYKSMRQRYTDYKNGEIKLREAYFDFFDNVKEDKIKLEHLTTLYNEKQGIETASMHIEANWREEHRYTFFRKLQKFIHDNYIIDCESGRTTDYESIHQHCEKGLGMTLPKMVFTTHLVCIVNKCFDMVREIKLNQSYYCYLRN